MRPIDLVKRIGAGFIIIIIALMMAMMFSSQNMSEITDIIAGKDAAGKFGGETIPLRYYAMAQDSCKANYQQFGNIPDFFLQRCIVGQLKNIYVIPLIAHRLGLEVSSEALEKDILERAKMVYQTQRAVSEDDRLSLSTIYRRELSRYPKELQMKDAARQKLAENMAANFPIPESVLISSRAASGISMQLRIVRFSNAELLGLLEKTIQIDEAEIRKTYEEEQAKLPADQKKSYENERSFVRNRVMNDKKQKALADLKAKLAALTDPTLEQVAALTMSPLRNLGRLTLQNLNTVKISPEETVSLVIPGLLLDMEKPGNVIRSGPHQEGEHTVYAEISGLTVPQTVMTDKEREAEKEKQGQETAQGLMSYILDQESKRGNFRLNRIRSEDGSESPSLPSENDLPQ